MNTLEDEKIHNLIEDFYSESSRDLVGLWEIAKEVESVIGKGSAVRERSLIIVRALLARGLVAGDTPYSAGGYTPWEDQNPDNVIGRVDQEWRKLGHTPNIPDIAWFGRPN